MAQRDCSDIAQRWRINKPQLSLFQLEKGHFIVMYAERARKLAGNFGCIFRRKAFGVTLIGKLSKRQCGRGQ